MGIMASAADVQAPDFGGASPGQGDASAADINSYVVPLASRLLWHIETAGWNVLGFEPIDGHHADYAPGSSDLPKVAEALRQRDERV
jgi:hypothetical protein